MRAQFDGVDDAAAAIEHRDEADLLGREVVSVGEKIDRLGCEPKGLFQGGEVIGAALGAKALERGDDSSNHFRSGVEKTGIPIDGQGVRLLVVGNDLKTSFEWEVLQAGSELLLRGV